MGVALLAGVLLAVIYLLCACCSPPLGPPARSRASSNPTSVTLVVGAKTPLLVQRKMGTVLSAIGYNDQ